MRKAIFLSIILLFSLVTGDLCQAGGSFCLQDLGTLGGSNSLANMLNDTGQIVGWAHTSDGETHAFLLKNNMMHDLGTLGGANSIAYGINDLEQIVGESNIAGDAPQDEHAALWENDIEHNKHDLGTMGGVKSAAFGINNSGWIVGASDISGATPQDHHAVLWVWENNVLRDKQDLGVLEEGATDSEALGINDSGKIVGWSNIAGVTPQDYHAVLWENDLNHTPYDLGTLVGGSNSVAVWINNSGQIVGRSDTADGTTHAVLWENDLNHAKHDLGTLGGNSSEAYAINEAGQIVGGSYIKGDVEWHAFLWQNGSMQDLGTLGGDTSDAFSINEKGQIVGASYISDTEFHAFSASKCINLTWLMLLLN